MKIVMIPVADGTGCWPCHYHKLDSYDCGHPSTTPKGRNCSTLFRADKIEQIYFTEDEAALARLRGTYNSQL